MEIKKFGVRKIFSLMREKMEKRERWSEIETLFLSKEYSHFELIRGTLGNKKKTYGITLKILPKISDDVYVGEK